MSKKNRLTNEDMDNMQNGLRQIYAAAAAKAVTPRVKELFETLRDNDMNAIENAKTQKEASAVFSAHLFALREIESLAKTDAEVARLYAEVTQQTRKATEKIRQRLGL